MLLSSILILTQDSLPVGVVFFAFYISGVSYAGQASNFSWANDACKGDEQERSIVLASMNMWSNAFNAWWSIVFFPADHAPRWERGMVSFACFPPFPHSLFPFFSPFFSLELTLPLPLLSL